MWPQGVPHLYRLKAYIDGVLGDISSIYGLHTIQPVTQHRVSIPTAASFLGQDASLLFQRDRNDDSSSKLEGSMFLREEISTMTLY